MGSIFSFVTDLLGHLDIFLYSLVSLGFSYHAKPGISPGQSYPVSDGLKGSSLNQHCRKHPSLMLLGAATGSRQLNLSLIEVSEGERTSDCS